MAFVTNVEKASFEMRYAEKLVIIGDDKKLILDFDGVAKDVDANQCLTVTDALHQIISEEYEATIKGPVFSYMRKG
jgi:hypothetical protein